MAPGVEPRRVMSAARKTLKVAQVIFGTIAVVVLFIVINAFFNPFAYWP